VSKTQRERGRNLSSVKYALAASATFAIGRHKVANWSLCPVEDQGRAREEFQSGKLPHAMVAWLGNVVTRKARF
jgi:hypothetical protein